MIVRLGYACISKTIEETTSSTYTYTNYQKEKNNQKLERIIRNNLESLDKILDYNIKNNIHFYRMSSKLIPLATKDDVIFDYITKYRDIYHKLSAKIKNSKMRVDFHPDQFCVLNSTRKEVVENTMEILKYHLNILTALDIRHKVLVLHIGSNILGKKNSLTRFIHNFNQLDKEIRDAIVIENDDKVFTIEDCLFLNRKLNIPIVLDYHHHLCNHSDIDIKKYIKEIFSTWKKTNPKVHFSSPKSKLKKQIRSHHDYIDSDSFIKFIELIKHLDFNIDIMIEAKQKDEALFRLIRELKYKTNYQFIDDTTFIP